MKNKYKDELSSIHMSETLKANIKMRVVEDQVVKKKPQFKYAIFTCIVLCSVFTLLYASERVNKSSPKPMAIMDNSNTMIESNRGDFEIHDESKTGSAESAKKKFIPKQFEIEGGMGFSGIVGSMEGTIDTYSYVGTLTTLPVYENTIKSHSGGRVYEGLSEKEMVNTLKGYSKKLNLDTKNIVYSYEEPLHIVSSVSIKEGKYTIKMNSKGEIKIFIEENSKAKGEGELKSRAEYEANQKALFDEYKFITNIKDPVFNTSCTFASKESLGCTTKIYENMKDEKKRFLNQNFNYTTIVSSKSADASQVIIDIVNDNLSSVIGEYQILNVEEAKETLLLDGYYTTSLMDREVKEKDIKGVELVYDKKLKPYMFPFYVFYIEQTQMRNGKEESVGFTYYVPALSIEELKKFPDIDWYFY